MPRLLVLLLLALLPGCASSGTSPDFAVPAGRYAQAFDAARDTLVGMRFELERVDAAAGVITTVPKPTAGLATPWDEEQSTLADEWEDLINDQQRRIRITFEPASDGTPPAVPPGPGSAAAPPDLRTLSAPLVGHVQVTIDRVHRSGWRLETSSIRFSSQYEDPDLTARAMWPSYTVAISQDPPLAARLAERIQRSLSRPASSP
jgi:hypothetical protein